ncbi:hypothetical protein F5Y03DRAFT_190715 [Xylaria venustula]|nr:hypothetical protein F5Y03DRAFT_190715 [Xylaria venustula]
MNSNHLPAGQPMPAGGPAAGPGLNGGRRRPLPSYTGHPAAAAAYQHQHHQHQHQHQHHQHQPHHHQQHGAVMYPNSYMNPYATAYYPPHQMGHHYQTGHGHMPSSPYSVSSYTYPQQQQPQQPQQHQQRSPPPVHQTYPPIVSSSMQAHPQPYPRPPHPQQPSPALSNPPSFPTAASPAPPPIPQTPTSTHSSQAVATPLSPITPQLQPEPQPEPEVVSPPHPEVEAPPLREFKYPLPWLSRPAEPFPSRAAKSKRRRRRIDVTSVVELPTSKQNGTAAEDANIPSSTSSTNPEILNNEAANTTPSTLDSLLETSAQSASHEEHARSPSSTPISHRTVPSDASTPTNINKS